jgi:hypothetical protein
MKNLFMVPFFFLFFMAGCAATPQVMEMGPNQYTITGEAEFDYNGMMQDVYSKAKAECASKGKTMVVYNTHSGYGSIGAFGSKRGFQLNFYCQ